MSGKTGTCQKRHAAVTCDRNQMKVLSRRRKELFGDCALIEIIHLHDCFRGSLFALEEDVKELLDQLRVGGNSQLVYEVERRLIARFKVIWGVFQAHSSAEDEFIWPTLKLKAQGCVRTQQECDLQSKKFETEEYAEDHVVLERRFSELDQLLAALKRTGLREIRIELVQSISDKTKGLVQHFLVHLENEEADCLPIVAKCLSEPEIHDVVGKIMGKRSADTIAQILTMAVESLAEGERLEMLRYMKRAMAGTFFDRWLCMSGWMACGEGEPVSLNDGGKRKRVLAPVDNSRDRCSTKRARKEEESEQARDRGPTSSSSTKLTTGGGGPGEAGLAKIIEAISANPELTAREKDATIRGVRDSVRNSYQRQRAFSSPNQI